MKMFFTMFVCALLLAGCTSGSAEVENFIHEGTAKLEIKGEKQYFMRTLEQVQGEWKAEITPRKNKEQHWEYKISLQYLGSANISKMTVSIENGTIDITDPFEANSDKIIVAGFTTPEPVEQTNILIEYKEEVREGFIQHKEQFTFLLLNTEGF
ncbi:hypothetical protein [Halalkalibacter alkaliphilus]|uniref:Lipoprotein n=1 Tax=Halalkalibacter alkaliphilus TaxID=2917993 RepID=A0A9X2CWU9_9BACI|nr:hypothetical protein [Halalkalibacter alkaliphilus]MCL7749816.1 hypothetical protein [Halalkalibacter alkaliphilus]